MKKKLFLMVMTVAMAVTFCAGCGGEEAVEVTANEVIPQEVVEEIATDDSPNANTSKAKNNGNYFIEIDNKIYFRAYPIGTLMEPLTGENFMIGTMGEQTDIMCYDKATGETTVAFSDCGQGKLCYLGGRFYFENCQGGMYSCLIDGSDVKELETDETMYFLGCDDETQSLIVRAYTQEGDEKIELWNDGEYLYDLEEGIEEEGPDLEYFTIDDDGALVGYLNDNTVTIPGYTENLYYMEVLDMVETQDIIDDHAYVIVNTVRDNGETDENNRYKYTRIGTKYLDVNITTGEVVEMAAVSTVE